MNSPRPIFLVKGNYDLAGGPETLVASLARQLDPARFPPEMVLLEKSGVATAPALAGVVSIPTHRVNWPGIALAPVAARSLLHLATARNAALLHTHDMRANLAVRLLRLRRRIPWIAHVHGWLGATHAGKYIYYEKIDARLVRGADLVLVGSSAARSEVEAAGQPNVRILPNAVDLPPEASATSDVAQRLREDLRLSPQTLLVGMVGRVHPGKGQRVLLQAMAILRRQQVDAHALIIGDGPDLPELRRLSAELSLQNSVTLAGFRDDAMNCLGALDVAVVPSLKESLPLTCLEAMARRRAVVASRVGDLPSVITDGESGLLVAPGNAGELASAIARLSGSESMRQHLGEQARKVIATRYSSTALARSLESIYAELLDARADRFAPRFETSTASATEDARA